MTKEEYKQKLYDLNSDYELKKRRLLREYCDANNPYKVGDIFTDHIGSILIERINYAANGFTDKPCCVFYGPELKKDGTLKKNNSKRQAWQLNDINKD